MDPSAWDHARMVLKDVSLVRYAAEIVQGSLGVCGEANRPLQKDIRRSTTISSAAIMYRSDLGNNSQLKYLPRYARKDGLKIDLVK